MIDHEHVDRPSARFQLQSELFLKGCEQRGTRVGWRTLAGIWVWRQIGRPGQIVVDEPRNAGSIDDGSVEKRCQVSGEIRWRHSSAEDASVADILLLASIYQRPRAGAQVMS